MTIDLTVEALALSHQLVPVGAGVGGNRGAGRGGLLLDRVVGSSGVLGRVPAGGEGPVFLCTVVDDLKAIRGLGHSARELLEVTVLDAVGDTQLLELSSEFVIKLILPVIFSNACFCSKEEELRKEVMKLVTGFHIQLAELVLRGGDSVQITVDHLEVVKHVL